MNLPRSSYYYRPAAKAKGLTDAELTAIIEDIQDEQPCDGYRRVRHELRRHGLVVNHKKIARVMREAGPGIKPHRRFVRTTDNRHDSPVFPNLYGNFIPDHPDRVWVADFAYIPVATGFRYPVIIRLPLSFWPPSRAIADLAARCQMCAARNRKAFNTTEIDEALMAKAANIGLISIPVKG